MHNFRLQTLWREWRFFIIFVLLLFSFRGAIADWYVVPTGSMKPTILEGDRIFVNKLAYGARVPFTDVSLANWDTPRRGDIVVFTASSDDMRLVKRVAGLPGDIIEIRANRLIINGQAIKYNETKASPPNEIWQNGLKRFVYDEHLDTHTHPIAVAPYISLGSEFGPVRVPEKHYFMLGDNRDNSADSRMIGFIEQSRIMGKASHVIISLNYDNYYLPRSNRIFQALP